MKERRVFQNIKGLLMKPGVVSLDLKGKVRGHARGLDQEDDQCELLKKQGPEIKKGQN